MPPSIRLPCGCLLREHPQTGAKYSVAKCLSHQRRMKDPKTLDQRYYQGLGSVTEAGELVPGNYLKELEDGIGHPIPPATSGAKAIEIGGGISPYASMFVEQGYDYRLVEPSEQACTLLKTKLPGITTYPCMFPEQFPTDTTHKGAYDVVFSAHSLEHMRHAINVLWHMQELLAPKGTLYLLIPNDDDLTNPDHFWFFNEDSIRKAAIICHLAVESIQVRQIVPQEKFMYCVLKRLY